MVQYTDLVQKLSFMLPETNPTPFENPVQEAAPKINHEPKTTLGLIGLVGILLLISVSALGGYKLYQQNNLEKEIATAQDLLEQQKNQLLAEDNKTVQDEYKKVFLDAKKEKRIYWTNVITRFEESLPQNGTVKVDSFAGSEEGTLSFVAATTENSLSPFLDTAILIESMKTKSFFDNVFVPSVSSVINEQGREFLNYSLRMDYVKEESDNKLLERAETTPTNNTSSSAPSDENINKALEELRKKASENNSESTTTESANTEENAN